VALEALIRHTGKVLAEHQVACLFKVPEAFTTTPCDFFGYTKDGRAILIECKEVARLSLPIGKSPGLAPHQFNALRDAGRANCIALVCWLRKGVLATIDIDMVVALSKDRRSIPWRKIPKRFLHEDPKPSGCLALLEPFIRAKCS
jgi:hypothetical protein